jgi:hypothetical protein
MRGAFLQNGRRNGRDGARPSRNHEIRSGFGIGGTPSVPSARALRANRATRAFRPTGCRACVLAWGLAAGLALGLGSAGAAPTNATVEASFFRRAAFDLEPGSLCYLRFSQPGKRLPLFMAGDGRRGVLRCFMTPGLSGYRADVRGEALVDMDPPLGSADALAVDETAAAGLLKSRTALRVTLGHIRIRDLVGLSDPAWERMIGTAREGGSAREPQTASADVTVRIGLRAGAATATVDAPMRLTIHYRGKEKFGRILPYWRLELTGEFAIEGQALGLTGADAGRLNARAVFMSDTFLPRDYTGRATDTQLEEAAGAAEGPKE